MLTFTPLSSTPLGGTGIKKEDDESSSKHHKSKKKKKKKDKKHKHDKHKHKKKHDKHDRPEGDAIEKLKFGLSLDHNSSEASNVNSPYNAPSSPEFEVI